MRLRSVVEWILFELISRIKNDQAKNKQSSIHRIRIRIWLAIRIRIIINFSIAFLSFLSCQGWMDPLFVSGLFLLPRLLVLTRVGFQETSIHWNGKGLIWAKRKLVVHFQGNENSKMASLMPWIFFLIVHSSTYDSIWHSIKNCERKRERI